MSKPRAIVRRIMAVEEIAGGKSRIVFLSQVARIPLLNHYMTESRALLSGKGKIIIYYENVYQT